MIKLLSRLVGMFCSLVVAFSLDTAQGAGEALSQLEIEFEQQLANIDSYVWSFEFSPVVVDDPLSPFEYSPSEDGLGTKGTAVYEVHTGKYVFEISEVDRWIGGDAPFISQLAGVSFDGKVFRGWQVSRHGKDLPVLESTGRDDRVEGDQGPLPGKIVSEREGADKFSEYAGQSGLHFFFPFFYHKNYRGIQNGRPISALAWIKRLSKSDSAELSINNPEKLRWEVSFPRMLCPDEMQRVEFDFRRGGLPVIHEWTEKDGSPYQRMVIKTSTDSSGNFFPEEIVSFNMYNGVGYSIVITDMAINQELSGDQLKGRFPGGTFVNGFVDENSYIVGTVSESEAEKSGKSAHRHKLQPTDMRTSDSNPGSLWLRLIIVSSSLAAFSLFVFYLAKKRGA